MASLGRFFFSTDLFTFKDDVRRKGAGNVIPLYGPHSTLSRYIAPRDVNLSRRVLYLIHCEVYHKVSQRCTVLQHSKGCARNELVYANKLDGNLNIESLCRYKGTS